MDRVVHLRQASALRKYCANLRPLVNQKSELGGPTRPLQATFVNRSIEPCRRVTEGIQGGLGVLGVLIFWRFRSYFAARINDQAANIRPARETACKYGGGHV